MGKSRKIRLLIAEDQPSLLAGLEELLATQDDLEVAGRLGEGSRLIEDVLALEPDVVLVDLALPGCGLRVLEQLATTCPRARVVVLALDENVSLLRSVLASSLLAYVVPISARAELLSTIRKMGAGRSYMEVPTGGLVLDPGLDPRSARRRELDERLALLSRREREVLEAVAYGFTNREIAEQLAVGVKSVETYRYRLAEKLGFRSRAELVRFALEVGLLRTPGPAFLVRS